MKETILKLGKSIALAKKILLINHIRMDPDAFGSTAALYYVLKKAWYDVKATNDEAPASDFEFLWSNDIFEAWMDITSFDPDLIISCDAASIDQLWESYKKHEKNFREKEFYVIDHHLSNPGFGHENIINSNVSSTCEIVLTVLEETWLDKYIDKHIATLLTAGIHTDTNIYYNSNTSPSTLRAGAKLMEYWADFRLPMFEFFKKKRFNKSKLWGQALTKLQKNNEWSIYWTIIAKEMFEDTDTSDKDVSGLINEFLANLEWMEVCFILYPLPDGKIKASLRSNGIDVSTICSEFWWGGHKQAWGFSVSCHSELHSESLLKDTEKKLLERLKKEL